MVHTSLHSSLLRLYHCIPSSPYNLSIFSLSSVFFTMSQANSIVVSKTCITSSLLTNVWQIKCTVFYKHLGYSPRFSALSQSKLTTLYPFFNSKNNSMFLLWEHISSFYLSISPLNFNAWFCDIIKFTLSSCMSW